jgi:hypothetical protein
MLPCPSVNHMALGQCPGPLFQRLIAAWSERVGVDIIGQAEKYHTRPSNIWREGKPRH